MMIRMDLHNYTKPQNHKTTNTRLWISTYTQTHPYINTQTHAQINQYIKT